MPLFPPDGDEGDGDGDEGDGKALRLYIPCSLLMEMKVLVMKVMEMKENAKR